MLLIVAYGVTRSLALDRIDQPEERAAAGAVWDAFLGDLRTAAWILAGVGAVVAATAASVIRPVEIDEPLRRLGRWIVTEPGRPALRALRGAGLILAGLILLVRPDAVLHLVLTLTGVYLIYGGFSALLRLIPAPPPRAAGARRSGSRLGSRRLASSLVAVAVIGGAIAIFLGSGGTTTAAPAPVACEGDSRLCDRPLTEVAIPATHNSMSVPLPGWFSAEQEKPIAGQLSDGIRGLLLDTHYAEKVPGRRLRTDLSGREDLRDQAEQDLSPQAVAAAGRIRERLVFSGAGKRGMYLCHGFCELGGTPLESVLDDIHDFLVANPGEVLVIINEDYVTPKDFVAAVEKAGLGELAYAPPASGAWPTLRQMIDRNQRVVFLAENRAGSAPWYQLAYDGNTEETPFAFSKVSQLTDPAKLPASCEPNRGGTDAPLFLMNHWITTTPVIRPSDAAKVNAYRPFMRRARECRRLRSHLPNLLAVNFYREGDLFRVVDTLNGL